ncbi:MAG: serine/threonine-protein kinase [Gemmatimonadetes bacterium]|nr:serine/threonine-protein kinase [Gemmatimonadota bacterium]
MADNPLERLQAALADRYAIERELGRGGMATVYLAHDVKHDRKVAVKVLRPELAAVLGAERFVQEIKTTANLQHPHILPLFDSGEADGFLYYVMPFIDGETLRDKLDRETQLGIDEAVRITTEVADALDYAHRHNVIHRDIKPENILLHDGRPMVADFGIALAVSAAAGGRMTETGLSLGTPHYMSPEQATAERDLTNRSDIYSLGCVLYEMLTGEPPHTGASAQAIVMKIVTDEARPVTELRKSVPPHVAAATTNALEKLPADRFATAKEFAEALTNPAFTLRLTQPQRREAEPSGNPWKVVSAILGVLVLVLGLTTLLSGGGNETPQVARFEITLPEDAALTAAIPGWTVALSPDGRLLVYVGPGRLLYVRPIDRLEARVLPGTEDSDSPIFSPDGEWVAFSGGPNLSRVALSGGRAMVIAEAPQMRGTTWLSNEEIIYAPSAAGNLVIINIATGRTDTITTLDATKGEVAHRWPTMLPNGKAFVFTVYTGAAGSHLATYTFASGEIKHLAVNGMSSHYIKTGHLAYLTQDGSLLAVQFDPRSMTVTGAPLSLVDGVMIKTTGAPEFAFSESGTLAYLSGQPPLGALVRVDQRGAVTELAGGLEQPAAPRFSPDGSRIAFELGESGDDDIWVHDVGQGTTTRLTFDAAGRYPSWTPDGSRIVFSSLLYGARVRQLFWKASDGSGVAEQLVESMDAQWGSAWLPDGETLVVNRVAGSAATGRDLWISSIGEPDSSYPFLNTEYMEMSPAVSPDGRWLAYTSDESGQQEVYVQPLDGSGGKRQVSLGGGMEPVWSPDGSELYYRSGIMLTGGQVVAIGIQRDPIFALGTRRVLFEDQFRREFNHANYDVHPTTGDFVMVRSEATASFQLTVVLNFLEELKARVGR